MAAMTRAQVSFVHWLKTERPEVYRRAVDQLGPPPSSVALAGLGLVTMDPTWLQQTGSQSSSSSSGGGWFGGLTTALTQLGTAYLGVRAQDQLIKLNIERARNGQEPLTAAQSGVQPTVGVDVRASPGILAAGAAGLGLPLLLGGAGLVWWLSQGGSRRRR